MKHRLPRTVLILGLVSFFNDLASEMVTPFIPILVATVLGGGPVVLGLIEGMADAVASFLKLWAGRYSDSGSGRRKQLTLLGYGISNLVRPLISLVTGWGVLIVLRSLDRVGKGIRSAPRDALLVSSVQKQHHGHAYGFQRALDNAGAMGGSLIAIAALTWGDWSIPQIISWSFLPGVLVMALLFWGVQEPPRLEVETEQLRAAPLAWSALSLPTRHYLQVLVVFTFARASEGFILLRANEMGMSIVQVLLLWAALNIAKSSTSIYGGRLADAFGLDRLTMLGWIGYGLSFIAISQVLHTDALWLAVIVYGLVTGLSEGSERALISVRAHEHERGTAFGWYHLAVGLSAIPAGVLFGTLWHYQGASLAFLCAGLLALVCAWMLRSGLDSRS
ncbi:MFS transporter [Ferriphaselus sp. R-1]|uniref:MFS transporter n=1 Tax=Ferriphaselus sp. R-1 TaxID=1485544 RepID=UPI000550CD2C|nr:MFS transporter [Ferriphaselus sp. R-1]